jgi:dolichol-phosphate mannosyltransferase
MSGSGTELKELTRRQGSGLELTVVAPTLNERENVEVLVGRLARALDDLAWEVVFVDDDSVDGTAELVRSIAQKDSRVRGIHRVGRRGLASACVEGAMSSCAPYIAVIDADLQHDERILPEMLRRLKSDNLDLVVGSRYVAGGGIGDWDSRRASMSRFAVSISQALFRFKMHDPMSGFFVIRWEAFAASVPSLSQLGFKILFDLVASSPRPLRFAEVPYVFNARAHGASKLDGMAGWQFGILILDKLLGKYIPVRFFLFAFVGGVGVVVSLASLYAFLGLGLTFKEAQSSAVLVAMTSNFVLNNVLTYRDRKLRGWKFVRGLLSFYLICGLGAVANVGIASLLFSQAQVWWVAGLAGAVLGAVWNYTATRLFTWRSTEL